MGEKGVVIQVLLAWLTFVIFLIKRYTDKPIRTWWIWFLDGTKQGFSMTIIHGLNVFLSIFLAKFTSTDQSKSDQCTWYLITFLTDVLLGTAICYFSIVYLDVLFTRY
jgi:hypothetical protein